MIIIMLCCLLIQTEGDSVVFGSLNGRRVVVEKARLDRLKPHAELGLYVCSVMTALLSAEELASHSMTGKTCNANAKRQLGATKRSPLPSDLKANIIGMNYLNF